MKKIHRLVIIIFFVGMFFQSFGQASEKYYITFGQEPWNNPSNSQAMTAAFGSGNWTRRNFTDTNLASIFTSSTKFIFIDGSAGITGDFNAFLDNHHDAFTEWVSAGGHLFINCGPDAEGDFGFDGSLENLPITILAENEKAHVVGPILSQPYNLTSQVNYTGTGFAHAKVSGAGLRPLIKTGDGDAVVLADKRYGSGLLLFGGMTTANFHQPQPQASQLMANILYYAAHLDVAVPLDANFTTSAAEPLINNSTELFDASSGYVSARTWQIIPETFEYVNGTNEHSLRPVVKFRAAGTYSVSLTVSNEQGQDFETKENYITVKNRRNFYWVGGDGWFGDADHWATTSGGNEFYDEEPTKEDIAIFDENSFSEDAQEILLDGTVSMYDLKVSETTHMPLFRSGTFSIYGSLTIAARLTLDEIEFELKSDDLATIDLSGVDFLDADECEISIDGTGSFDFVSSFSAKELGIWNGTVSARSVTIAIEDFYVESNLPGSVDLANSELQVAEYFGVWCDGSPFTSDFKLVLGLEGNESNLEGFVNGEFILNDVTLSGEVMISSAVTFKKLTITPGTSVDFDEYTGTVDQIDIRGTVDAPITMTNGALKKTSGTVVAEYVQLADVIAEGGAAFYADKNSEDNGGNTGWIFATKEVQAITFTDIPDNIYGVTFDLTATNSSGLPVAYSVTAGPAMVSGNSITITGVGEVTVRAFQEGDDTYLPAQDVVRSFTVVKAPQNLDFTVGNLTFGQAPVTINTTPGESGNDVTYSVESGPATISGNVLMITGAGIIIIKAVQEGNDNYLTATVSQEISIAKATQEVVFTSIPDKTFGDAAFNITATGGESGNPVVFSVTSGPATLSGGLVTLTGAGPVTIEAFQSGNDNYIEAIAEQTFCVNPEKPSITVTGSDTEAPVLTSAAAEGYQWYNSGAAISGATGNTYTVTEAGIYTVAINASNCVSIPSDAHVLIVTGIERTSDTFVKTYPNPVVNELIVDLPAVHPHPEISVILYDVSGRLMTTAKAKGTVSIPMQSYRPGQYAVIVHFDTQRITKHIIKK